MYTHVYIHILCIYICIYIYIDYLFVYLFMNAFITNDHSAIRLQGCSLDSCLAVCEALVLVDLCGRSKPAVELADAHLHRRIETCRNLFACNRPIGGRLTKFTQHPSVLERVAASRAA